MKYCKGSALLASAIGLAALLEARACDLCAINSANTSRAEATGWVFTVGSQHVYNRTLQFQSMAFTVPDQEYRDTSIIHLIPGYNFNRDLGISLNVPWARHKYRLYDDFFTPTEGKSEGIGDISLIGRWTPYSTSGVDYNFRVNLLGGVKLPTGDTRYLELDVAQEADFDLRYPAGHNHAFSGVHYKDLTLGSGSVDGTFGVTTFSRWKRFFLTTEAQYYLRTRGEKDFKFGDTVMLSAGPGFYAIMGKTVTLNFQVVGRYENTESSEYGPDIAGSTGMREIYIGPQTTLTYGPHLSFQIGGDLPLDIRNRGLMVVPDYRIHTSATWSF